MTVHHQLFAAAEFPLGSVTASAGFFLLMSVNCTYRASNVLVYFDSLRGSTSRVRQRLRSIYVSPTEAHDDDQRHVLASMS